MIKQQVRNRRRKAPVSLAPILMARELGAAPMRVVGESEDGFELQRICDGAPFVLERVSQREGARTLVRYIGAPLDRMYRRHMLTIDEWSAGERYRTSYHVAYGSFTAGVNLDGFHGVTCHADNWRVSQRVHDKRQELIWIDKCLGEQTAKLLRAICVMEKSCATAAASLRIANPKNAGPRLFREGLVRLAALYRQGAATGRRAPSDGGASASSA